MSLLIAIPALVRVLIVFAVILICIRRKLALGHCFTLGALLLGLLFGMPIGNILLAAFQALTHPKTFSLAAVVSLILILSHSLEASGQMERLLDRFQGLIHIPALNIVIFPAIIGLLPMPGGAIFSAPMVKNLSHSSTLSASDLSYINYWFRHIWEYWWPLYPGVLLITALGGLNLWALVLTAFPITLVSIVAGYWPLRGKIAFSRHTSDEPPPKKPSSWPFFKELMPIWLVIVLGIGAGVLFSRLHLMGSVAKESGLILALLTAIVLVWQVNGVSGATKRKILINPKLGAMIYMVASILVFKGILEDSRAVVALSNELLQWKISLTAVAVVLPLLVGLVSGITIAFVGTTFPILLSLIEALGATQAILPYMILGLVSGFVGVLFSPLHVCLLLSNEYFETAPDPVYRQLLVPCLALLGAGLLYFHLLCRFW